MKRRILNFIITAIALLLWLPFNAFSQRNCGTMASFDEMIKNDPILKARMEKIEYYSKNTLSSDSSDIGIITIPVVVHVIYNTSTENISTSQVQSQIEVLNKDFRRTNTDADNTWSQAADSEIQFALATEDPSGNSTSGITRTYTSSSSFSTSNLMKYSSSGGHDAWPSNSYLNIWICNISGGILGYAQFPGGYPATDGVVLDYQYTGTEGTATYPFHLGRTATHEVGHWLNLRHIWGDGACGVDDLVLDTPESDAANYSCGLGSVSCSSVDMVQNYMDYSDDLCMNLFTQGQKTRMRTLFQSGGFRESILNNGTIPGTDTAACDSNALVLTINFDSYPEETSWQVIDSSSTVVASSSSYSSTFFGQTIVESICLPDGTYTFQMLDSYGDGICCSEGNGSYSLTLYSDTLINSNGTFAFEDSTQVILNNQYYRFDGPGSEWETANYWNKKSVPDSSYMGPITIASGCYKIDGIELIPPGQIIVLPSAFFSVIGDSTSSP